jgi:ribosomal protein L11 methyltransferase
MKDSEMQKADEITYEIGIDTGTIENDILIGFMFDLGCDGFVDEESFLKCYVKKDIWTDGKANKLVSFLKTLNLDTELKVTEIENRNWNAMWESSIEPIEVTNRIVIKPTWKTFQNDEEKTVININPKMSFGTGYHETTHLMLRLMEDLIKPGQAVLDVGTGSGILAIAAAKLGAKTAVGVDNDEWAFMNAKENVELNAVSGKVDIKFGTIKEISQEGFDLVLANLTRSDIIGLLDEFRHRLCESGFLLVSGLLREDEGIVLEALGVHKFQVVRAVYENEWLALALRKNDST